MKRLTTGVAVLHANMLLGDGVGHGESIEGGKWVVGVV